MYNSKLFILSSYNRRYSLQRGPHGQEWYVGSPSELTAALTLTQSDNKFPNTLTEPGNRSMAGRDPRRELSPGPHTGSGPSGRGHRSPTEAITQ